jgi:hypothetical protein
MNGFCKVTDDINRYTDELGAYDRQQAELENLVDSLDDMKISELKAKLERLFQRGSDGSKWTAITAIGMLNDALDIAADAIHKDGGEVL